MSEEKKLTTAPEGDRVLGYYDRNAPGENDHYAQPGIFYRQVLSEYDKKELIKNISGAMSGISGPKKDEIINRQLCRAIPQQHYSEGVRA
jgi:catalase